MFDTYITVTGNALTTPEKKNTTKTNTVVASFRVASHVRRFNKNTQQWVDGPNLRIKVNCWRRLADNVCASIVSGDPVVVYGRIATREWLNEQGEPRISYEIEADAVGHDLSRGRSTFTKMRSELGTTVIEDEDSENRVNGEPTPRPTSCGGGVLRRLPALRRPLRGQRCHGDPSARLDRRVPRRRRGPAGHR